MTSPIHPVGTFRPVADQPHADPTSTSGQRLIAPGSVNDGSFGMFEITVPPGGGGATPHFHKTFTESFYVLDGRIRLRLGDSTEIAGPGDFAFVPKNGIHGFSNATADEPARMLIIFTPGAPREEYFAEMAALHDRPTPPTDEEIDEVARRHDQTNLRHLTDQVQ